MILFFISENKKNFSVCSKNDMKAKLEQLPVDNDDCFRDVAYDESFSDLQISLCGNGEVEIGEDCDCGMNIIDIFRPNIRSIGLFCDVIAIFLQCCQTQ